MEAYDRVVGTGERRGSSDVYSRRGFDGEMKCDDAVASVLCCVGNGVCSGGGIGGAVVEEWLGVAATERGVVLVGLDDVEGKLYRTILSVGAGKSGSGGTWLLEHNAAPLPWELAGTESGVGLGVRVVEYVEEEANEAVASLDSVEVERGVEIG